VIQPAEELWNVGVIGFLAGHIPDQNICSKDKVDKDMQEEEVEDEEENKEEEEEEETDPQPRPRSSKS